jgi:hypothetical protein
MIFEAVLFQEFGFAALALLFNFVFAFAALFLLNLIWKIG